MFTKEELEKEIFEYEQSKPNYENCKVLALLYTIHDHKYGNENLSRAEKIVSSHGDSEFLTEISGLDSSKVWKIMDELMQTLELVQPKLHETVMLKIRSI